MDNQTHPVDHENIEHKRRNVILLILLGAVVLAVAAGLWWRQELKTSITTDNAKVTGDIIDVSPKVAGRLESVMVKEEQEVKVGQVLANLDQTSLRIALNQAEAGLELAKINYEKLPEDLKAAEASIDKAEKNLAAARAKVKNSEIALADANRNLEKSEALYQSGALSKDLLDSAKSKAASAQDLLDVDQANMLSLQAALEEARANSGSKLKTAGPSYAAALKQSQALYETARYNYQNSVIVAPCNGRVVRLLAQPGENVSLGQTIVSICNIDSTWITANIEEKKIGRVKPGQKVDIKIDSYPGQVIPGRVVSVGSATQSFFSLLPTENSSGNYTKVVQRLPVKIIPLYRNLPLKPGMSAQVKIHTIP